MNFVHGHQVVRSFPARPYYSMKGSRELIYRLEVVAESYKNTLSGLTIEELTALLKREVSEALEKYSAQYLVAKAAGEDDKGTMSVDDILDIFGVKLTKQE